MILGPGLALEWDTCDGFVKITVAEPLEEGRGGFKLGRDTSSSTDEDNHHSNLQIQKNDQSLCL